MGTISKFATITAACGAVALATGITRAADINAATSGDWSAAGTSSSGERSAGDNALITGSLTVGVSQPGEAANRVDLGTVSGQTGTLNIISGVLTVGANPPAGADGLFDGKGALNIQNSGTVNTILCLLAAARTRMRRSRKAPAL